MTDGEVLKAETDWLGDYAKRVRQRKNDLPEAETWSFNHILNKCGVRQLADKQPWIGGILQMGSGEADRSEQIVTVIGTGFARVRTLPEAKEVGQCPKY